MNFKNTEVFNFAGAFRGMRNPLESWHKSDIKFEIKNHKGVVFESVMKIGNNDLKLAQSLIKGGTDHSKFMRQITVCVDITAPLYWWKEFDTYKVGTTANSTSTMHKIHSKPFGLDDFSYDQLDEEGKMTLLNFISVWVTRLYEKTRKNL